MKRVVITGIGLISSIGNNTKDTWKNIIEGKSGIKEITSFNTEDYPCKVAGEIRDFNPEDYIEKKEIKKMGRFTQLAVAAAKMALSDSELVINKENEKEVGIIIGSGVGGIEIMENSYNTLLNKGVKKVSPFTIPAMIGNMAAGVVAIYTGAKGINKSIVTACATGSNSIGDAFEQIKLGKANVMIVGGTEACITPLAIAGFSAAKTLATKYNDTPEKASRPFDKERDGFVMGEGAGILILEDYEYAIKRNAKIYAEIVGYGESNDAYHLTSPHPEAEGAIEAINRALISANIDISKIDYINAHGTGTHANDTTETKAFKKIAGEYIKNISISSTKGATGHVLGATGAIEAGLSILAIKNGIVPPTINLENKDEECNLDYTPNVAKIKNIDYVMSTSFGFGGHNSVLIFKKFNSLKES
ncbi:MAG: beta-ketoacyl-ACP synthase II [Fusobacteriaceae bacterium]|nr:beta-ketoacyl-ACP synthase II [Fusobacteriaceae bacterium]